METPRKKIQPGVALLFCVVGFVSVRQGYPMENTPQILLTIIGSIWIVASLVISVGHLTDKIKKERTQN
jgi:hypothetical protein